MREEPHSISRVKIVSFHNLHAISFNSFQEYKLVNTHFTGYSGKKTKWQFNHRMKPNKSTDTRIHFFDWQRGMSASKCMNPSAALDTSSHDFCSFVYILH